MLAIKAIHSLCKLGSSKKLRHEFAIDESIARSSSPKFPTPWVFSHPFKNSWLSGWLDINRGLPGNAKSLSARIRSMGGDASPKRSGTPLNHWVTLESMKTKWTHQRFNFSCIISSHGHIKHHWNAFQPHGLSLVWLFLSKWSDCSSMSSMSYQTKNGPSWGPSLDHFMKKATVSPIPAIELRTKRFDAVTASRRPTMSQAWYHCSRCMWHLPSMYALTSSTASEQLKPRWVDQSTWSWDDRLYI